MKKKVVLLFFALSILFCSRSNAQTKRIMLFDDYEAGIVLMNNKSKIPSKLNYDTANKKMMYMQDNQEMILINANQVDTVFIAERKFIPIQLFFLEVVETQHGTVFINWSLKEKYKGNKGAYGQITQNKVETINTSFWTNGEYKNQPSSVLERENSNEYWFYINDKPIKCRNEKDLIKHFRNHKEEISIFIKKNKISFKNTPDAIKLVDYCLKLNNNTNE